MKKLLASISIIAAAAALSAYNDKVSNGALEEARATAKSNAEFNGRLYKAANPRFTADFTIVGRSDDLQSAECPQGDGWADLSIMRVVDKQVDKVSLVCSTYSSSVGCYRKEDFDKIETLTKQNGRCSKDVPFPLPVLVK